MKYIMFAILDFCVIGFYLFPTFFKRPDCYTVSKENFNDPVFVSISRLESLDDLTNLTNPQ